MRIRSRVAVAVCAAALGALGASAALAGESTGNGRYINGSDAAPLHGNSNVRTPARTRRACSPD